MSWFYGDGGTIHQTGLVNVELDKKGKVVAVWFRCITLPFTETVVAKARAEEMRKAHEPGLDDFGYPASLPRGGSRICGITFNKRP